MKSLNLKTAYCYCLLLLCPIVGVAQNGITISNFAAAPGTGDAPTTLTFNIRWSPPEDKNKVWSDTVWVFIDYNNASTMTRLPLSGATLTNPSWTSASVTFGKDGNDKGAWIAGNARTSSPFSATVQLLTATATATLAGACIYAINYPPVGRYTAANEIQFNGTPPFYLTLEDESSTVLERNAPPHTYTYTVTSGNTVKSFTDASLAPGVINCKTPAQQTLQSSATVYCAGSGVTFALSGTDDGAVYRLIKEGASAAATLTGTGSPATFSGTFTAGTYHVETAPGAFCPATLTSRVTVTEVALPVIESVSATTVCAGTPATITAVASLDNATYTWTACGSTWSTTSNSASVTCSETSSGSVYVADQCKSAVTTYPITVATPASAGQPPNECGCDDASKDCNNQCTTIGTTERLGTCAACGSVCIDVIDQCGDVATPCARTGAYTGCGTGKRADWDVGQNGSEDYCKYYCAMQGQTYRAWSNYYSKHNVCSCSYCE